MYVDISFHSNKSDGFKFHQLDILVLVDLHTVFSYNVWNVWNCSNSKLLQRATYCLSSLHLSCSPSQCSDNSAETATSGHLAFYLPWQWYTYRTLAWRQYQPMETYAQLHSW